MRQFDRALLLVGAALVIAACGGGDQAAPDTPSKLPSPRVRQPVDPLGYTHTAEGIEAVIAVAEENEKHRFAENAQLEGVTPDDTFVAAISPHDDHRYAAGVYAHVYPHIRARHVIAIGVAHKARDCPEVEGKLVFDSHSAWHGPYGPIPASALREDLLAALGDDAVVHDDLQRVEHSIEGTLPFLQHYDRQVEIVPILVPYMSIDRLTELAEKAASALGESMKERGLISGQDVAILISSDSVHYGDEGWGGKRFDDFGVDQAGYDAAVARDLRLVEDYLVGPVSTDKAAGLYGELVKEDFHEYEISWCGRFSIPFGLALLDNLPTPPGRLHPCGILLRYGTTLDPGPIDPGVPGLGFTAPANLRHWVGFVAVGFK